MILESSVGGVPPRDDVYPPCWMLQSLGEGVVDTEPEPIVALNIGAEGCREDHVSHPPLAAAERHRHDDPSHHERRHWQRNFHLVC